MKYLILFTLLSIVSIVDGQKIETVHVKDIDCKYDTTAIIKNKVKSNLHAHGTQLHLEFLAGENRFLYTKIYTTECTCTDCSESFELAINIDSLKLNEIQYLKKEEVIWIYDNAWIEAKEIKDYLGYIKLIGENTYEIKISEMLNATIIRSIQLKVKASE